MGRKHHNTQAGYYDPRTNKDSELEDESKRRKMIRWIKTKIGLKEQAPRRSLSRSGSTTSNNSFSNGYVTGAGYASYNPYNPYQQIDHRPHILIVGAGIGGLCLAQGLKKAGIPFTIFERDPTPNYRTQGYRLRINGSGYEALKANLSPESFEVFLRSTGQFQPGFCYMDAETAGPAEPNATFQHQAGSIKNVISADRAMLRSLLLLDLSDSEIQYGMAFKRYQVQPNGRVQVTFENGRIVEGSILVGADGTTSRVRRQYIPRAATLLDTDSGAIYGKTPLTPEMEKFFATEGTTMVTAHDPPMALVIEPKFTTQVNLREFASVCAPSDLPDLQNYICWVLLARAEHFHLDDNMTVQDLFAMTPAQVANVSCAMARNWHPKIRAVLEHQSPEWCSFLRISTISPDIKIWQPSSVTLLGDAVHTMAPAGIGCNTALHDAMTLVKNFKQYGVGIDAITAYERVMRENGREGIAISVEAGKQMYNLPSVKEMRAVVY